MCPTRIFRMAILALTGLALNVGLASIADAASGRESALHQFAGASDGSEPFGALVMDSHGNLYGTTRGGGASSPFCGTNCGTVFELSRSGTGWAKTTLYQFTGGNDGYGPEAGLVLDKAGNLYGTTYFGGGKNSAGIVFELKHTAGGWHEQIIHRFNTIGDGGGSEAAMVFDGLGNLIGTTLTTVFKLSPGPDGWTETVLHTFDGSGDGNYLLSAVTLDDAGNIYGTAAEGGTTTGCVFSFGCGMVFELSPNSDGSWSETVLHYFDGNPVEGGADGAFPWTTPIFDSQGNLYGATAYGGDCGCVSIGYGMVYELTPNGDGTWTESDVYEFKAGPSDGDTPIGNIVFDKSGNIFGTTAGGGNGGFHLCNGAYCGTIFELSPVSGGWTETVLFNFAYWNGAYPSGVIIDSEGALYGTAEGDEINNFGTVFEFLP